MSAGNDSILSAELLKRLAFTQRSATFVVLGEVLRSLERLSRRDQLHVLCMATIVLTDSDK